jgi:hypothetical protein
MTWSALPATMVLSQKEKAYCARNAEAFNKREQFSSTTEYFA